MWAEESVIYQIYPLGMCGAPYENDGVLTHRILEVKEWIPHLKKLGITAVYFCPLFESDTHGYNTRYPGKRGFLAKQCSMRFHRRMPRE